MVVKRALLSCFDKAGLDHFAQGLSAMGIELIASGGTAQFLSRQGLAVKTVEEFTGVTEQLDGRVKTLHPVIHAGILARRDNPDHVRSVGEHRLIDLVVVNLYPFEQTIQRPGVSLEEAVEQIDIGGVALLRAAAKNFASVAVVSQPHQYGPLIDALRQGGGQVPLAMARQLAVEAFALTTAYDRQIVAFLATDADRELPETISISLCKRQELRYGENPHQRGAWYAAAGIPTWGLGTWRQLQGKALSYNNLLDADAALRSVLEFDEPTCVIVKHGSQCGVASAAAIEQAYDRAYLCDQEAAFGGVVGCNRCVNAALAERLTRTFLELIMAPAVEPEAVGILGKKPNLRVLTLEWPAGTTGRPGHADALAPPRAHEWRQLLGGWLLQTPDALTLHPDAARVVTKRSPTTPEHEDLMFAWRVAKHVKSNSIVLVRERAAVGIGQGQPSRVGSVRLAIANAGARSHQAVAASDGFFPFPDGVELLAKAGVTAVIQPGGSIRDAEVIAAADQANIAMMVTGVRHFRH